MKNQLPFTRFWNSVCIRIFSPSRMAKYLRGLATSYGSLGVAVLFTAVTVPLGVAQMGLEGWGVWIFCQQASATICLFESFTQSAFVRLLIQVKDDTGSENYKKNGSYGSLELLGAGGFSSLSCTLRLPPSSLGFFRTLAEPPHGQPPCAGRRCPGESGGEN